MNTGFAKKYLDLISGLRDYIGQEHPKGSWITTDAATYAYFVESASKLNPKAKQPPPIETKPIPQALPPTNKNQSHAIVNPPPITKVMQNVRAPESLPAQTAARAATSTPPKESTPKEPAKSQSFSKTFMRELPSAPDPPDFIELRTFFKNQLPHVELTDTILDDSAAIALTSRWKAPLSSEIIILSFSELAKEQTFISNLAFALNQCLGSTQVLSAKKIEDDQGWNKLLKAEKLRLVIASNYNLHTLPELVKYFHEDATGKHKLGTKKLYLLSDISLYMQQPSLKSSLWKTLCQLYR